MKILFVSEKCDMSSFIASSILSFITQNKIENYYCDTDGKKPIVYEYILSILSKKNITPKEYESFDKDITDIVCINVDESSIKNLYSEGLKTYHISIPIFPDESKDRKIEIGEVYFDLLYSEIIKLIQKDAIICSCEKCSGSCSSNKTQGN